MRYIIALAKLIGKSLATTLFISYIILCIIYVDNDTMPVVDGGIEVLDQQNENISDFDIFNDTFDQNPSLDYQKDLLYEQPNLIGYYVSWLLDAAALDFGSKSSDDPHIKVLPIIGSGLYVTVKYIFSSILIASLIASIFITLRGRRVFHNYAIEPILSFSFFPVIIVVAISNKLFGFDPGNNALIDSLYLAFGSSVLIDYYMLLVSEHDSIMDKDYVVFADNSGFMRYSFAFIELLITFISISTSRIPILFGGMIVIEILSGGATEGIGFLIWEYGNQEINYRIFFSSVFITIIFFSFFFYLSEEIARIIDIKDIDD